VGLRIQRVSNQSARQTNANLFRIMFWGHIPPRGTAQLAVQQTPISSHCTKQLDATKESIWAFLNYLSGSKTKDYMTINQTNQNAGSVNNVQGAKPPAPKPQLTPEQMKQRLKQGIEQVSKFPYPHANSTCVKCQGTMTKRTLHQFGGMPALRWACDCGFYTFTRTADFPNELQQFQSYINGDSGETK